MPLADIQKLYIEKHSTKESWKTSKELAKELGVKTDQIYSHRCRHNLRCSQRKNCLECNQEFQPRGFPQKYCSVKCQKKRYRRLHKVPFTIKNCIICNNIFKTTRSHILCEDCRVQKCYICKKKVKLYSGQIHNNIEKNGVFNKEKVRCGKCRNMWLQKIPEDWIKIIKKYTLEEPKSLSFIAKKLGCSSIYTIQIYRRRLGLDKIEISCLNCGKKFIGTPHRKYCSKPCSVKYRNTYRSRPLFKRKCLNCGKEFETMNSHKKNCSRVCKGHSYQRRSRPPLKKKNCLYCNQEFETRNYRQKYCSHKCGSIYLYYKNRTPKTLLIKICSSCEIEFETTNKHKKFCSRRCRQLSADGKRRIELGKTKSYLQWSKKNHPENLKEYFSYLREQNAIKSKKYLNFCQPTKNPIV